MTLRLRLRAQSAIKINARAIAAIPPTTEPTIAASGECEEVVSAGRSAGDVVLTEEADNVDNALAEEVETDPGPDEMKTVCMMVELIGEIVIREAVGTLASDV